MPVVLVGRVVTKVVALGVAARERVLVAKVEVVREMGVQGMVVEVVEKVEAVVVRTA